MSDNIHCSDEINFYPPTHENLLQNYNKREAGVVRNLIAQYKSKKDTSEKAITDVARHIFLMYHLDPRLIGKASYGGDKSKAKVTSNKKIKSIDICIAEKKAKQ
ncbi:MAG TPA: hypothetical protein PK052_02425 [Anaerohalosphaeraceae bacterium]|nr:hypothetical protein [Anaerohalosphaeraceae bacterium]HOM75780.1 hypothetical protein [Anaerohalosphaeraceae bacterium]HPC64532.1 hypothetical protein [Anaerohalosphaeraceae bacterium]HPO70957.1 hypothetical protein [Anaerohalosphaeraceae bacterium]HRS70457.1 hypothetical protein [Anaerohalosphaeraceae bacterium]